MTPFTTLTAVAAPMPLTNIDTDMIIPKQFLRTIKRTGLGKNLFNDMRYDEQERPKPDFVLNRAPYDRAQIIVAGANFGCGSSREHAPWALLDFGIRCVIASSFADIFYNNCFKNGILPLVLKQEEVEQLLHDAEAGREITIDLERQTVTAGNKSFTFEIDSFRKHCLSNGLDDIGLTLQKTAAIDGYEARNRGEKPWLWPEEAH